MAVLDPRFRARASSILRQAGATPHHGARASHHRGLPRRGAQAPDAQSQQPWLTGPAAPRHAGSPQTRARTRVPCTGRQTPNHCATREAPLFFLINTVLLPKKCINKHKRKHLLTWFPIPAKVMNYHVLLPP